jgi:amphi-Trp domain-containing protein
MEKKTIEIEESMTRDQAADYFRMLANGLQSGSIEVKSGEETLTLTPTDMISVEIEAKQKKDKSKFTLEMSWRLPAPAAQAAPEAPVAATAE